MHLASKTNQGEKGASKKSGNKEQKTPAEERHGKLRRRGAVAHSASMRKAAQEHLNSVNNPGSPSGSVSSDAHAPVLEEVFFTDKGQLTVEAKSHVERCSGVFFRGGKFHGVSCDGALILSNDKDDMIANVRNRLLPLATAISKLLIGSQSVLDATKQTIIQQKLEYYLETMFGAKPTLAESSTRHEKLVSDILNSICLQVGKDAAMHLEAWPCNKLRQSSPAYSIPAGSLEIEVCELNKKQFSSRRLKKTGIFIQLEAKWYKEPAGVRGQYIVSPENCVQRIFYPGGLLVRRRPHTAWY